MTLLGIGLLAGCATTGTPRPNANLDAAKVEEAELVQRVDDLFLAEGVTQSSELPGGDATYDGQIYGSTGGGTGPDLEYVADLTLEVDFDTDTLTGTVSNVETDLGGFASPVGSVTVSGGVTAPGGGTAGLNFTGSGNLAGADRTAEYAVNASGAFIGDNADAARGIHETDFEWLNGPDAATTSWSDGRWTVEQ